MSMGLQGSRTEAESPEPTMKLKQPLGACERARLAAVRMLGSLLAPPLQALCNEAHARFGLAGVAVNLVDAEEVRQQAWAGRSRPAKLLRSESPCDAVICGEVDGGVLVVQDLAADAAADARCKSATACAGFYAGVAITYSISGGDAQKVGTLCVYGADPQVSFGEDERSALLEFGKRVSWMLSSPLGPLSHRPGSDGNEPNLNSVSERVQALLVGMLCD